MKPDELTATLTVLARDVANATLNLDTELHDRDTAYTAIGLDSRVAVAADAILRQSGTRP